MELYLRSRGATHQPLIPGLRIPIIRKKIPECDKFKPRSVWTICSEPDKKPLPIKPAESKKSPFIALRDENEKLNEQQRNKKRQSVKKFRIDKLACLERLMKFEGKQHLSTAQVRKIFKKSRKTLKRWENIRGLEYEMKENSRKRFNWNDLYSWICQQYDVKRD